MNSRVKYILSYDTIGAMLVTMLLLSVCPTWMSLTLAKDFYALGTSVLSIVFSVFIAALAIIISASDNDFVRFLEEDGSFSNILSGFRVTVLALFGALCFGIFLYVWVAVSIQAGHTVQYRFGPIAYGGCLAYALFATLSSTFASMSYAKRRARFLRATVPQKK